MKQTLKLIGIILLIVLISGCGDGEEKSAREVAEGYMDAVRIGDKFDQIDYRIEGFIDVFDYEYLQTIEAEEKKKTVKLTRERWERSEDPNYPTFEDYKDFYIQLIDNEDYEILQDTDQVFEYWEIDDYYNVFTFLYNVEIADEVGQKIYKKAEITVEYGMHQADEEYVYGYYISDIYLR